MGNGTQSSAPAISFVQAGAPLAPDGRPVRVEILPLDGFQSFPGRILGIPCGEAQPTAALPAANDRCMQIRPAGSGPNPLSEDDLYGFEHELRRAALSTNEMFLLGVNATPAVEVSRGNFEPLYQPSPSLGSALAVGAGRGGVYQLMRFPIGR